MRANSVLFVAVALVLGACAKPAPTAAQLQADSARRNISLEDSTKFTEAQARAALSDKTHLSLSAAHGPQIEYSSADGRVYLWYPGNNVILPGTWEVKSAKYTKRTTRGDQVTEFAGSLAMNCYRYGSNTYNPVTRSRGSRPECEVASKANAANVEVADGDIFGLSQRSEAPFVLTRDIESFAQVRARVPGPSASSR